MSYVIAIGLFFSSLFGTTPGKVDEKKEKIVNSTLSNGGGVLLPPRKKD